ncbi:AMP-binding protein [Desulfococcaceae bacterium HSG9]|nr:AMP-binding protein [Desulfococcaceae bacterium HSG9]
MGLYDLTIYDLIRRNARLFANRPAWFEAESDKTYTFAEYGALVDKLASGLQSAGLKKGDRIGVLGQNSLEYFMLYGAAAALGAIVLPLNWRLSQDEIVFNLNDCEPKLLFADSTYQEVIQNAKNKLSSVSNYYNLIKSDGDFQPFNALTDNDGTFEAVSVTDDDSFAIVHTAAVAGRPRGAVLSHRNLLCASMHLNQVFKLSEKDVHLNLLPMFHVAGLLMFMNAFHAGLLNVNMRKFDAALAARLIADKKVSVLFDFAPIMASIIEQAEKASLPLDSLRAVIGLDAPETIEKYQRLSGGTFYCMYGQTETAGFATIGHYNDKPGSAGKIISWADVKIVDDNDALLPAGQTGEITMQGPMIFKGYWNLEADTAHTFRNGLHHTGDLGQFDEDGFLWFKGRKAEKELIKPGGENVYPAEVENVILQHPAVEKTVVFGVPDPKWKEGIKAVCQLKPGESLEAQDLIEFVGERIARYKKPQYVEFTDAFPLLENGIPDRLKVKELFGGGES